MRTSPIAYPISLHTTKQQTLCQKVGVEFRFLMFFAIGLSKKPIDGMIFVVLSL